MSYRQFPFGTPFALPTWGSVDFTKGDIDAGEKVGALKNGGELEEVGGLEDTHGLHAQNWRRSRCIRRDVWHRGLDGDGGARAR